MTGVSETLHPSIQEPALQGKWHQVNCQHWNHQYIKILRVCVCVCVCEWRKWDVRGAGLDYSDARPSYFNLFTEPWTPRRMFENIGPGHGLESSMQSGSSSRSGRNRASSSSSGRNRGAAVEADAIGRRAAAEAGAIREQQLDARRRQTGSSSGSGCHNRAPGAAAEVDASGEQQLKRRVAALQRAVRRRITHGRRTRGK